MKSGDNTAHEHIEEFDLIHMNGRVYDSIIGRFISADPNIFYPFDTQDFNRYSYTKNNPLKYVDPSGDVSGNSFKDRAKYDSRINEHNRNELSRLNLQYKVDKVTKVLSEVFNALGMIVGVLAPKSLKGVKTANKAKSQAKGRGGVKQNIHTNATREEVKESLKANGFKERATKSSDVTLFENEKGQRYSLRSKNSSGLKGSILNYYGINKRADTEIRLGD
ncbi:RHS repeat domain-containing protein [Malaciobacter sp. WC5094]